MSVSLKIGLDKCNQKQYHNGVYVKGDGLDGRESGH